MKSSKPLIVGEVLFDCFEDGQRVLGGAPLNVAWNLHGFGLNPLFLSAVGADAAGKEVADSMVGWGMDTAGLQTSKRFPTGIVQVKFENGEPTFEILDNQAYDDINAPRLSVSSPNYSLLYAGSLAYRHKTSGATIRSLIQDSGLPLFVDVNIRQPWFRRNWLNELFDAAHWIKLNQQELSYITGAECRSYSEIQLATEKLSQEFGESQYWVTCGSNGALAIDKSGELLIAKPPAPDPMIDSVGAGDAFSGAVIFGIVHGFRVEDILQSAVHFASATCTFRGALTNDLKHYQRLPESMLRSSRSPDKPTMHGAHHRNTTER